MKLSYYELEGHLRKEVRSLYVVMGEQELLRELAVSQIRRAAIGEETTPFNFERFDGDECDAQAVVMAANQLPMLGGRRAIVVTRANAVFEGSPELLAFVDDPAPSSVLVLELGKKPDARRKAWKELEKKTTVVVCDSPKGAELERWIGEQARERKLKLGREAVRYLIEEFGSDLRRLLNEL